MDARTQNPEQFFESLPEVSYPLLKQRKLLSNALRHRPWLKLYLFEHLDEMGYAAPTAVSIAPIGYFSGEYNERWIDLELLPSPLDRETAYGYVLHNLRERFPENAGEEKEDNEEEELEEEDEDETGDHKKKSFAIKPIKPLLDLAVTDFEGEGVIYWSKATSRSGIAGIVPDNVANPLVLTREIFHGHASKIRDRLRELHPSNVPVTEEKLNDLFEQLLWR